jgi:hypothetical protein
VLNDTLCGSDELRPWLIDLTLQWILGQTTFTFAKVFWTNPAGDVCDDSPLAAVEISKRELHSVFQTSVDSNDDTLNRSLLCRYLVLDGPWKELLRLGRIEKCAEVFFEPCTFLNTPDNAKARKTP